MQQQRSDGEQDAGGNFSLDRVLSALRRRILIVIGVPLATLAVAIAFALSLPNRYDAAAVVQIDPRKKSIANIEGVISELKADAATVESEVEIIRSRAVALKVIDVLRLREDADFTTPTLFDRAQRWLGIAPPDAVAPERPRGPDIVSDPLTGYLGPQRPGETRPARDEVASAFAERLKVARVRTTLLIEIRFSARDPVKAARIANTIAEVYLADQLEAKHEVAGHAAKVLEAKLESLKVELSERERRVAAYKARNDIMDTEGQILGEKQLARQMEQSVAARNATAEARARFELAERLAQKGDDGAGIADVLQSHTVRLLKEQLGRATGRAAELATRYGNKHPEMLKVRAEVSDARSQLAGEIARLVSNLRNEYVVAEQRERDLAQSLDKLKATENATKEAGVELKDLMRDAETSRALYEALLSRYKQTVETQSLQLPDARIVEQADAPLKPASPKRQQIVALASAGGLVLGIAIALFLEFMTLGIGRPEDVERVFELAHLASLPTSSNGEPGNRMRSVRMMLAEPSSSFAEAIRELRREIDVRRPHDGPRIIQVASGLPNDGGSTVASNLAHHYAMTGARVLLIDGDMRRASLTRKLTPGRSFGLAEVLTRTVDAEQAILFEASTRLCFLPANGPAPSQVSPPELAASEDMTRLLAMLRPEFDIIVVDAPPLLPVIDGRILADHADQIVFVMTWRKTPKQLARKSLASLGFNQSKLVGVVVNEVDDAIIADANGGTRQSLRTTRASVLAEAA